jgi:hypothetical protein
MKFDQAEPQIMDAIRGEAKLKGINLNKDRTLEEWSVMVMILLQHIFDNRRT